MAKTKTIKQFNQDNIAEVRKEVEAALAKVGEKFGLTVGIGRISFMGDNFSCKLSAVVKTDEVAATETEIEGARPTNPKWIQEFNRYAPSYGFKKEHLGKIIKFRNVEHKLVGWRNRANYKAVIRNTKTGDLLCVSHKVVAKELGFDSF